MNSNSTQQTSWGFFQKETTRSIQLRSTDSLSWVLPSLSLVLVLVAPACSFDWPLTDSSFRLLSPSLCFLLTQTGCFGIFVRCRNCNRPLCLEPTSGLERVAFPTCVVVPVANGNNVQFIWTFKSNMCSNMPAITTVPNTVSGVSSFGDFFVFLDAAHWVFSRHFFPTFNLICIVRFAECVP